MRNFFVDACKGWAIIGIVSYHYIRNIPNLSDHMQIFIMIGGIGAHVFFFFSGWGLTLRMIRKNQSIGEFFINGVKKIYLPAVICVSFIGIIGWYWPHIVPTESRYAYRGHILLYKMFDPDILGSFGSHFRFLSTLYCLYATFPFLFHIIKKYPTQTVIASIGISASRTIFLLLTNRFWMREYQVFFLTFLWEFVAGMRVAIQGLNINMVGPKQTFVGMIVCIILYGTMSIWGGTRGRARNDIFALPIFLSICILCSQYIPKRIDIGRIRGAVSYDLFLRHGIIFMLYQQGRKTLGITPSSTTVFCNLILILSIFGLWGNKKIQKQEKYKITNTTQEKQTKTHTSTH